MLCAISVCSVSSSWTKRSRRLTTKTQRGFASKVDVAPKVGFLPQKSLGNESGKVQAARLLSFRYDLNNAELALGNTTNGANYCYGSASNPFTLVLDFDLPPSTSSVLTDSRSFMSEDTAKDQFSRISALQFSDIDLTSSPKKGRVSVSMFRKRPPENFSNNRVRITIASTISGGGSFSTTGRVKLTCP